MSEPTGSGHQAPRSADLIVGVIGIVVGVAAILNARTFPNYGGDTDVGSGGFPIFYSVGLIFFCAVLIASRYLRRTPEAPVVLTKVNSLKIILGIVVVALYIGLIPWLGYLVTTPFFLAAIMQLMGMRGWKLKILLSVAMTGLLYAVFLYLLMIPLPVGSLLEDYGLL